MSKTFDLTNATNKNLLIKKDEKYFDPILENMRKIDLTNAEEFSNKKVTVYYTKEYIDGIINLITLYRKKGIFDGIDYIIEPNFIYENSVPFKDINNIVITIDINIYFNIDNIFDKNVEKYFLPRLNLKFNVNIPQDLKMEYTLASDIKERVIFYDKVKILDENTVEYKFEEIPFSKEVNTLKKEFDMLAQDFIFDLLDSNNFSKYIVIGQNKISAF